MLAPAAKISMTVVAMAYLAIGVWFNRAYDVEPVSRVIAGLQRSGAAVAHLGRYHGQFQFAGRLQRPMIVIRNAEDWRAFTSKFPRGYVVAYSRRTIDGALYSQKFRSRSVFLSRVDALSSVAFDTLHQGDVQSLDTSAPESSGSD